MGGAWNPTGGNIWEQVWKRFDLTDAGVNPILYLEFPDSATGSLLVRHAKFEYALDRTVPTLYSPGGLVNY